MGYNVVGAMNTTLSWYETDYYFSNPDQIGRPLAFTVVDGEVAWDLCEGFPTVLVINKDYDAEGNPRPDDIPKVEMLNITSVDDLDGWEEQVIPGGKGFIVENGVNNCTETRNDAAPRSLIGIKPDGKVVIMMNDGRQSPYSEGMNMYECAQVLISAGCTYAFNCDGGGTSQFLSQRPGEELKVNCSPSDSALRATTQGIVFISTAPATGEFVRATISTENQYYTPGSTVEFSALGTDLVGTKTDIPAEAVWQIKESGMGTIDNGVFVSNGNAGTVTAQIVYGGEVVGEHSIEIVIPETFTFAQSVMTVPFGKEVEIELIATANGGLNEIVLNESDVIIALDNTDLGTITGFTFASVDEANAPDVLTGTITATLKCASLTATATLTLGKGSEAIFDFENGIDGWIVNDINKPGMIHEVISHANAEDGQVHDGSGSLRLEINPLTSAEVDAGAYTQAALYLEKAVIIENAKALGFWIYIPDDFYNLRIRMHYFYDSDGNGTYDKKNSIVLYSQPAVYYYHDEPGWYYFSTDISAYESIMITGLDQEPQNASKNDPTNYRFIEISLPHTGSNALFAEIGSVNGIHTLYLDNITVDYSDAVEDREAPVFSEVVLLGNADAGTSIAKREPVTTDSNLLSLYATVSEDTDKTNATGLDINSAKVYIDGVQVDANYANGKLSIANIAVADGMHRIKFEICDNAGNKSVMIRLVNVQSGVDASTVQVVPADTTLDRLYGGSVYWMNINASDIETVQSVETVIDLNGVNHWELDHMVLADGFTASYTVDSETNTATIVITRVGENNQTGAATLASLPIRIISFDNDIHFEGYTAETFWNSFNFWPQDLKVDVDKGVITYVDGYTSEVLNTFSNEEFSVDTEMYTISTKMDATFKEERGTCHVHTVVAMDDKVATCTESGYTGRTYCEVCDSVVDWGTTVPATGHNYEINENGVMACTGCDGLYNGEIDGITYIDGVVADGWVADTYYYVNGVKTTGSVIIDGKMCTFDENGTYMPECLYEGFYDIDGTVMYYISNEYVTGLQRIDGMFYNFDGNGLAYNGKVDIDGTVCTFDKGVSVAEGDVKLAGIVGEDAHFILYTNGKMLITGSGAMTNFKSVGTNPWYLYQYRSTITTVEIAENITSVGNRSFINSHKLSEVIFKGKNIKSIDDFAFAQCPALKNLVIPEGVTRIDPEVFSRTPNLEYVYVPTTIKGLSHAMFNASENVVLGVVEGSYAHKYAQTYSIDIDLILGTIASGTCGENATWELLSDGTLTISGSGATNEFVYSKYSEKSAPWAGYRDVIKKVVIGNGITSVGDFAFYCCTNLTAVEFEAGSVLATVGVGAFGYTGITEITLPASVKTVEANAFYYSDLVTVSFEDGSKLTTIGEYAFRNCTALANVYIPDSAIKLGSGIFYACTNVTLSVADGSVAEAYANRYGYATTVREPQPSVIYDGTCGGNVTWALYDNGTLVLSGNGATNEFTYGKYSANAAPWSLYRADIKKVVIGNGVTSIGDFAFYGCSNLTSVEFKADSALTTIGVGAFGYTGITDIVLPASVKTVEANAFYYSKLVSFSVEADSKLTTIGEYAFRNCTALTSVKIPASVTKIGAGILYACDSAVIYADADSYAYGYAQRRGYSVVAE